MAHAGIFATSSEILTMAGENYDTSVTEAKINELCLHAESVINCITRRNWSDDYASLNADVKGLLSHAEACFVAGHIICYNLEGYVTEHATTMLDFLWANFNRDIQLLKDIKVETFIDGES